MKPKEYKVKFIRRICVLLCMILCLFLLTACGQEETDYSETTIDINKKGTISNTIVENFNKDYYNSNELKQMIEQEIAKYQSLTQENGNVKLVEYTTLPGQVKAVIDYKSYEDYKKFNEVDFYYGPCLEASLEGIDTNVTLVSYDNTKKGMLSDLSDDKMKLIVFSEPVRIKCFGKIKYVSANVEIIDEKQARMSSDSVGTAYIIFE